MQVPGHSGYTVFQGVEKRVKALGLPRRYQVEIPVTWWEGRLWGRISAQVYNELREYQKLADAVCDLQTAKTS